MIFHLIVQILFGSFVVRQTILLARTTPRLVLDKLANNFVPVHFTGDEVLIEAATVLRLENRTTELELWRKGRSRCTKVQSSSQLRKG